MLKTLPFKIVSVAKRIFIALNKLKLSLTKLAFIKVLLLIRVLTR